MTSPFDPKVWSDLERDPAPNGLVRRRILPQLGHDIFIAEQRPGGLRQLTMSIHDRMPVTVTRGPRSRGLDVHIDASETGVVRIDLASTSQDANTLFGVLAADTTRVLEAHPGEGAASLVLQRVLAWQTFFSRRDDGIGPERAAGLFAELEVLRDLLVPAVGSSAAVTAWHGPDPALQDFQFTQLAIEVKSFRGNGPGHLAISSERQLDQTGVGELFVAYLRLDQRADGPGITLADQVERTAATVDDSFYATDLLGQQLLTAGWQDSVAEVRTERYEVRSKEIFAVAPNFPRLVSSDLPAGIGGERGRIDLVAIPNRLPRGARAPGDRKD
jgi:hypothetical protein